MKKILFGQLLIIGNMLALIAGYYLLHGVIETSRYLEVMTAILGTISCVVNLLVGIFLQLSGYRDKKALTIFD